MNTRKLTGSGLLAIVAVFVCLSMSVSPALASEETVLLRHFGGSGAGQLSGPTGIALGPNGDVYVLDKGNDRVEYFNSTGTKVEGEFNGSTSPTGAFSEPNSIAVDDSASSPSKGDVYVADSSQNVIDKFSATGVYVGQLTGPTGGPFEEIEGIAVDPSGNLWVHQHEEYELEFDNATPTNNFLSSKEAEGGGVEPAQAIDSENHLYVVRSYNKAVWKLELNESDAEFAGALGTCTKTCPATGVGVDPVTNNVYVTQGTSVAEYGPFGEPGKTPVAEFGSEQLKGASAVAISTNHEVYVADATADDVDIYNSVVLPNVTTGTSATGVTGTSATLEGTVNPLGTAGASYYFEYGTSTSYGSESPGTAVSGTGELPASATVTGLLPNTTYYYRLDATNSTGYVTHGDPEVFTTPAVAPTVNDHPTVAGEVLSSSVRLEGTVDPENSQTFYYFEYGPTAAYGATTPSTDAGLGYEDELVAQRLSGLAPGTTYHYALVASNPGGIVVGPDSTFTTAAATPPLVSTGGASGAGGTSETLTGAVEAQGLPTTYRFELGPSESYGAVLGGPIESLTAAQPVSATFANLPPGVTYHYRLVASNEDGTVYGLDETFTTPGFANPLVLPVAPPLLPSAPVAVTPAKGTATATKALTRAQKLQKALKACKKKAKGKRSACEKTAKKQYGPATKRDAKKNDRSGKGER